MRSSLAVAVAFAVVAACGDGGDPPGGGDAGGGDASPGSDGGGDTLASRYPGDVGLQGDPAVVFVENFEAPSIADVIERWEYASATGLALVDDVPPQSSGDSSLALSAGGALPPAADLYTRLPGDGHEQLYVRWYVNYEAGGVWAHSGVWFGGYNPSIGFPFPMQGMRPVGDDRVLIAFEPDGSRMDFHNYWMKMRDAGGTFRGNAVVHDRDLVRPEGTWLCIEVMVRLNTDPASPAGGELALWWDDDLIVDFTEAGPRGFWIEDDFCANDVGDDELCRQSHPGGTPDDRLDLQYRSTPELALDHLWPQNYNEAATTSTLELDDLVVATERIGCIR